MRGARRGRVGWRRRPHSLSSQSLPGRESATAARGLAGAARGKGERQSRCSTSTVPRVASRPRPDVSVVGERESTDGTRAPRDCFAAAITRSRQEARPCPPFAPRHRTIDRSAARGIARRAEKLGGGLDRLLRHVRPSRAPGRAPPPGGPRRARRRVDPHLEPLGRGLHDDADARCPAVEATCDTAPPGPHLWTAAWRASAPSTTRTSPTPGGIRRATSRNTGESSPMAAERAAEPQRRSRGRAAPRASLRAARRAS